MPRQSPMPNTVRGRLRWAAPAAVFAAALGLRAAYLSDIKEIGFFDRPMSDGYAYDQRARGIAQGDWLGPPDFVHAPLYAYLLGVVRLVGGGLTAARCVQVFLGATSCVLILLAARRFFDLPVAVAAAAMLAFYPPAIFFDGLIQKTSLALLLSVLLLYLLACCTDRPSGWRWGATGVALGLLVLTRQNALLLAPVVLVWLWLGVRSGAGVDRLWWTLAWAAGFAAALSPWAIRNRVVTGELVLTTPNLGQNFAMGNNPRATGTYLPFKRGRATAEYEQQEWVKAAEQAAGRSLSASEVSDYYLDAALSYIKAHPGPWLRLMLKKWLMVWGAYEAPDTEDYYLYQEHAALLRFGDRVLHFGILCPMAAGGLVLTLSRWRRLWLLYAWLAATALGVAAFVVFARYRFPLVPVLTMFAGAALVETARAVRQRRARTLVAAMSVLALATVVVNWPVHLQRRTYSVSYVNHAVALADQRRFGEALRELNEALALSPDHVDAHLVTGSVLLDLGRFDEALRHYEHARTGDPGYGGAYRGIGNALAGLGRFAEAAEQFRQALQIDPDDHVALNGLATATARQGRFMEAVALFEQVLERHPDYPEACLNLGNTYLEADRPDEAAAAYERALRLRPDYTDALHNLGVVEINRGQTARAVAHFTRVLELQPDHGDAQRALAAALIQARRWDDAIAHCRKLLQADPSRRDMLELLHAAQAARDRQE